MENSIAEEQEKENNKDYLTEICREGAQRMLAAALETEIAGFIEKYKELKDKDGHQAVVRNGYQPARTIQTGIGDIPIQQPRIDDRVLIKEGKERFSSEILPKFMRKSPSLEAALPVLYLQGISTNKFQAALEAILGKDAKGLSASTITRLKEAWTKEYDEWAHRSLKGKEYAECVRIDVAIEGGIYIKYSARISKELYLFTPCSSISAAFLRLNRNRSSDNRT